MIKKIDIDGTPVSFNTSLAWMILFRSRFERDPIEIVMPALKSAIPILTVYSDGELDITKLTETDWDMLTDVLCQLNAVDLLELIWATAKNADKEIPEPEEWYNSFEVFPMDEVITEIVPSIAQSLISTKKFQALRKARDGATKKKTRASKASSRAASPEG